MKPYLRIILILLLHTFFGSYSSSKAGPISDVDIALLLKGNAPEGRELIHEEDYLAYRIGKILGINEVDLIDLNSQKLILCHNVLKTGRLIYDADTAIRIRFETRVISSFCDFEPTLRFMERFHLQGIIKRCTNL
ncbi:MAG TPA: type VII toxin-antitoxin system MntA family adenylyltransferase antitoxin [Candidatus Wujingus californicus]|uniref:type VII toxin-antitoxin system MntA family adenylyltransferase antitoxin n=1 Tax=Candidatus Wujingus californicus TaxID=3367618 RepID=UPI001D254295|nr:nucleotidyltransferase domain-containing protein [Planctomycetota bacterium]MDO8131921.1 nucleotidyltransferase domain-containing protein [Candidatus Brocadiales bacterium]